MKKASSVTLSSPTREALIERVFALRPVVRRCFEAQLHHELQEELRQVTVNQLSFLEHLRVKPLPMRELARSLGIGESSATATADRLVRQGLVTRLDDPADRRLVLLALTEAGTALIDRVQQVAAHKTSLFLASLSDSQLAQLVDIFETLREAAVQGGCETRTPTERKPG